MSVDPGHPPQDRTLDTGSYPRPVSVTYEGRQFRIHTFGPNDHISSEIAATKNFYELELLRKAYELYLPGTLIVDIGGYLGNHTVFFAGVLGARVITFEPNPAAIQLIHANIEENQLPNVLVFPCALGSAPCRGTLQLGPTNNLGQTKVTIAPAGEVELRKLDDCIDQNAPVGIIKVDVEQHELDVILGAKETIRASLPHIFVECQTQQLFARIAEEFLSLRYRPVARFCFTPTYLFSPLDEETRLKRILPIIGQSDVV